MRLNPNIGKKITPDWLDVPIIGGLLSAFFLIEAYDRGLEVGMQIQNITEIVWIERQPEPINMTLWDVECVLVAKESGR